MKKKFATRAIHTGCKPEPVTGAVMTPIFQTSTFVQESPGKKKKGYAYARTHNPTRTALETNIASLEEGDYGLAFPSGMSAMASRFLPECPLSLRLFKCWMLATML
jgi:cystathionine beta-lyase/cystathionine gamma-synthase